jgi:hypothetical protein
VAVAPAHREWLLQAGRFVQARCERCGDCCFERREDCRDCWHTHPKRLLLGVLACLTTACALGLLDVLYWRQDAELGPCELDCLADADPQVPPPPPSPLPPAAVGFGRIVVSETERPNLFVDRV